MIPEHAKKVYSGILFEIWQWEQRLFDGSTTTFEEARRQGAAKVLAVAGENIVLCKELQPGHENAYITLPGGRLDGGETSLEGAKRELKEELGLQSNDWELLFTRRPMFHVEMDYRVYIARDCKKTGETETSAGEKTVPYPVTFEELLKLGTSDEWFNDDLKVILLRASYDKNAREALRKKFFGT